MFVLIFVRYSHCNALIISSRILMCHHHVGFVMFKCLWTLPRKKCALMWFLLFFLYFFFVGTRLQSKKIICLSFVKNLHDLINYIIALLCINSSANKFLLWCAFEQKSAFHGVYLSFRQINQSLVWLKMRSHTFLIINFLRKSFSWTSFLSYTEMDCQRKYRFLLNVYSLSCYIFLTFITYCLRNFCPCRNNLAYTKKKGKHKSFFFCIRTGDDAVFFAWIFMLLKYVYQSSTNVFIFKPYNQ